VEEVGVAEGFTGGILAAGLDDISLAVGIGFQEENQKKKLVNTTNNNHKEEEKRREERRTQ